ncbi:hypothetical protein WALSEDRAFT_62683 [Wallemia mellicola CBS 633.66]|uniref:Uncharacterized protein n=1 Tax=Wallemia mellicola (strain ATCC MYA-4683 / CBS 633.66) TaxID=671144 RepID=I4YH72_WALMC|nr:hypothetical protein WALSEDRAFT_62683 [Wallemia mellicola CBS 633.66]EIM23314.1 hypothetical protein WALSEDRAFT_62683 [Wallemia mellicola CBS 633.66]|eukprot:XP_006956700.1 hypothetical protein WALSEDRAFT_62683 [Wallemia mellicola CBS 633.66]
MTNDEIKMNTQLQHKWQLVRNQRDNFSNGGDPEDDVSLLTPFPYRVGLF